MENRLYLLDDTPKDLPPPQQAIPCDKDLLSLFNLLPQYKKYVGPHRIAKFGDPVTSRLPDNYLKAYAGDLA
ncbi:hypothetical protein HK097_005931, partial [Rhizophlyctis rosea]